MNNLDKSYQALLQDILDNGVKKQDRTGTGTISVFGRQIRHKMSEGFPLLTTKKMYFQGVVAELLWFLRGETNIKPLVDNNCHIWNGDAYKNYCKNCDLQDIESREYEDGQLNLLNKNEFIERIKDDDEFAKKWGDLGPVYGKQWRNWGGYQKVAAGWEHGSVNHFKDVPTFDQIAEAIHKLKTNPDDRGIIVSAWNVGELDKMVLRPCHNFFQFYTRELSLFERTTLFCTKTGQKDWKERVQATIEIQGEEALNKEFEKHNIPTRAISLMYNARSQDVPLGTPFNLASYGLLLEILAKEVNMIPDELITNMGDCHIYLNQIDGVKEQLTREPYLLPSLKIVGYPEEYINPYDERLFDEFDITDFKIENYQSHPTIKMPLSN